MQLRAVSNNTFTFRNFNKFAALPSSQRYEKPAFGTGKSAGKSIVLSSLLSFMTLFGAFSLSPQKASADSTVFSSEHRADKIREAEKIRNQALQKWESLELENCIKTEYAYLNDFNNMSLTLGSSFNNILQNKLLADPKLGQLMDDFSNDMAYVMMTRDILLQEFGLIHTKDIASATAEEIASKLASIPAKVSSEKLTPLQRLAISEFRGAVGSTLRISHEDIVRQANLYTNKELLELREVYRKKAAPIEDQIQIAKDEYNIADQELRKIKEQ